MHRRGAKRKSNSKQNTAKKQKSSFENDQFVVTVDGLGIKLSEDSVPSIRVEIQSFKQDLLKSFPTGENDRPSQESIQEFVAGYEQYISVPNRLRYSLLPIAANGNIDTRSISFSRILLNVSCLQTSVALLLFDKILDFADQFVMGGRCCEVPKLILSQVHWLDYVTDGKVLADKLLEILTILPVDLQRDIIQLLPEIISDCHHSEIAQKLQSILETESTLIAACIDALSNLNVSPEQSDDILQVALERMSSCDCSDVPVLIKFVSLQVTQKNCVEVIGSMRNNLDVETCLFTRPIASSTPREPHIHGTNDGYVILNSLYSSLNYMRAVTDGWIKVIGAIKGEHKHSHTALDLFILCMIYSIPSKRKSIVTLVISKIKSGLFDNELIKSLYHSQLSSVQIIFPNVLALCEKLTCSSANEQVLSFAKELYILLFTSFDTTRQQEVIGSLVTNIGSGISCDCDCALDVLESFLDTSYNQLAKFTVFIKSILDYLDQFNMVQIRRLYTLLGALTCSSFEDDGGSLSDDFHSIIRKQLFHHDAKFRQMGVIGAVIIISQIASQKSVHETTLVRLSSDNNSGLSPQRLSQATAMLQQVTSICADLSMFYEEMSLMVTEGHLHKDFLKYLLEEVTLKFQELYVIEATCTSDAVPSTSQSPSGLPTKELYNLDPITADVDPIAIALYSLIETSSNSTNTTTNTTNASTNTGSSGKSVSIQSLSSHFKLLRTCERALNGGLEEVDALLGCPVVLCSPDQLELESFEELSTPQKQSICASLIHCINWFRELVSSFASESEVEMKWKVLLRIKNIVSLQKQLKLLLTVTSGPFPTVSSYCGTVNNKTASTNKLTQKAEQSLLVTQQGDLTKDIHDQTISVKKGSTDSSSFNAVQFLLRPLEMSAYNVLSYNILSRSLVDTHMEPEQLETISLEPNELLFLLESLKKTIPKGTFGKVTSSEEAVCEFVKTFVDNMILSGLCDQLETLHKVEEKDCTDVTYSCILLIYEIIASFYKLSIPDDYLKATLRVLLNRLPAGSCSQRGGDSMMSLAGSTITYFQSFTEKMPNLNTAAAFCKVLASIVTATGGNELKRIVSELCKKFLDKEWNELDHVMHKCDSLEYIIRCFIEFAPDSVGVVEQLCHNVIPELIGDDPVDKATHLVSLTLCAIDALNKSIKRTLTGKEDVTTSQGQLTTLGAFDHCSRLMFVLVNYVKSFDSKPVLLAAMKYGNIFVETCTKYGLPLIDASFKSRKDEVLQLIKSLQKTTRCLQHYCGHSKVAANNVLTNHVPQLKKTLETFLFEVKAVMINHDCSEAFFVANLKNRNLQGEEILTQVSQLTNDQTTETSSQNVTQEKKENEEEEEEEEYEEESY